MEKERCGKYTILVADNSELNRSILAEILGEGNIILEATDGLEVLEMLQKLENSIDLVLLDMALTERDGFEVLAAMNRQGFIESIPVIVILGAGNPSHLSRAFELGATDFIRRPFDATVIRRRVTNTLRLYAKQKKLLKRVADQMNENEKNCNMMIHILSHVVEFRNGESGRHVLQIHTITELLLNCLVRKSNRYPLTPADIALISTASSLHDIGKITIPEGILNKPGKLTKQEFELVKNHTVAGEQMLKDLPLYRDEPLAKVACEICRWHHERYDGKGYPDGLIGDEIPISAQIVALADVYDALVNERAYKKAFDHETALEMIQSGECGVFQPLLLECLVDISGDLKALLQADNTSYGSHRELEKLASELLYREESSLSEHTIRVLEEERAKYQFFDSLTREVQFEYTVTPPMVRFSDWGASYLGLDEVTLDPTENRMLRNVMGIENLISLGRALRQTTPQHADVQLNCRIQIKGEFRWCRIVCRALWSTGEPPQYLGAIGKLMDIDEEHTQMLRWRHRASYDGLTGLLNTVAARERIQQRLRDYPNRHYVLLMADVDRFKAINDTRGHTFGDQVLQSIAEALRQCIREEDIAARVGGDEFLAFLEYDREPVAIARRIFAALPRECKGYPISVSIGAVTTLTAGRQYESLFHRADQALYAAKFSGKDKFYFYDDSMRDLLSAAVVRPDE